MVPLAVYVEINKYRGRGGGISSGSSGGIISSSSSSSDVGRTSVEEEEVVVVVVEVGTYKVQFLTLNLAYYVEKWWKGGW